MVEIGYVREVTARGIVVKLNEKSTQDIVYRNGIKYEMPKMNQYIKVHYLDVEIVAQVEAEVIERIPENIVNNKEEVIEDYHLFNRIINAKIIGYFAIDADEKDKKRFKIGPKFSPIVFNIVSLLSEEEIEKIISVDKTKSSNTINIGKSIINNANFYVPLDKFFNSHMAIFGNTGSGKSNTLTKVYTELFRNYSTDNSRFIFIDFNGEYEGDEVLTQEKDIIKCNTSNESGKKIVFSTDMFKDSEIMSVLYNATEKTQKPFLNSVLNSWNLQEDGIKSYITNCFGKVFEQNDNLDANIRTLINRIIEHINSITNKNYRFNEEVKYHNTENYFYLDIREEKHFECKLNNDLETNFYFDNIILKEDDENVAVSAIELTDINKFDELLLRLELRLLSNIVYNNDRYEFINPLINSVVNTNISLKKVFDFSSEEEDSENNVIIYSLKECNQEMKKVIPLILAKKEYNLIKKNDKVTSTHFIIDEAHNILSEQSAREGESWKDYRLETFEEIIKEGRKFGFFITLASQRPSDISSTLVSQVHNFLIHKLVNERDLLMIKNVVSTLSKKEYEFIPQMGQGMCVMSGIRFSIPQIIQVDNLKNGERPNSDDIDLGWTKKNKENEKKNDKESLD